MYETKKQLATTPGNLITYATGDKVYAGVNGLVTNVRDDAYEYNISGNPAPTVLGIVKVAPDSNSSLLVIDLRI